MRSATLFFPRSITLLMKRESTFELNFGSGRIGRLGTGPLRGMPCASLLLDGALGAVLGAPLLPVRGSRRVERAANDVIADPGEILDASAADQDHRVLLEIVPNPRDVRGDFLAVGQPDAGDFAQRRIRLFR